MALLRPGIGKEEMDRRERPVLDHALEHFHRVMADDAQVDELARLDAIEQATHAGPVDLDRDEIRLGMRRRNCRRRLAHARADFEYQRGIARGTQRRVGKHDAIFRQQRFERALLRRRDAPLAQDKAANWPTAH
jgi:hypothetical protein